MTSYDYIIVGAGAAGCVLAYRLSENPSVSVALMEAGGDAGGPSIQMPKALAKVMTNRTRTWFYPVEPEQGNAFQRERWARGRMLGGSTSLNGMMYVRGMPEDYDAIAAMTSDDWSWKYIGAAYHALECHELGEADSRGAGGPQRLTLSNRRTALTEAMIEAGVSMGLPRKEDTNSPDKGDGIGYSTRTIWKGRRQSAVTAFIDPIRNRPNLTILPNTLVDRVRFDRRRAIGVSIASTLLESYVSARREVILAGGAMASPGILQRSGIGPAALLRNLGIPLIQENSEVGQHLLEHRGIMMQWKLKGAGSDNAEYGGWRLPVNVARYYLTRGGPLATAAYEIGAWFRAGASADRPDIQFLVAPFSFDLTARRTKLEEISGMSVAAYPLRPTSCGEINIRSVDPNSYPVLKANYHTTPEDRALMIETVRLARQYADQRALREFIDIETYPGPACVSDEEILDAYDRHGSCAYHAVGTCRMGADARSVVDPKLRVRGVENLRIMDTSIMPQIPSGNTHAPTLAMAWRAADLIAEDSSA